MAKKRKQFVLFSTLIITTLLLGGFFFNYRGIVSMAVTKNPKVNQSFVLETGSADEFAKDNKVNPAVLKIDGIRYDWRDNKGKKHQVTIPIASSHETPFITAADVLKEKPEAHYTLSDLKKLEDGVKTDKSLLESKKDSEIKIADDTVYLIGKDNKKYSYVPVVTIEVNEVK